MKTVRSWTAWVMIAGGFVAGVATVVSMSGGVHVDKAFAGSDKVGHLVGKISAEESTTLHNLNSSLTNLAEYVKPAVVHVRAITNRSADSDGKLIPISGSEGAGFVYRKDGYVITNDHVVGAADQVTVITNDGREHKGTVKRAPEWDVAVIKIDGTDFPTLGMADSKSVLPGQMVMAIGSPYGLENSVTFGHVSATKRENSIPDSNMAGQIERFYPDLIQTDAAINVGNSGGPLVNIDGQVIGMNSSIYTKTGGSNGIAFAIPANEVRFIADMLIQKGKITRSQLGVYPRDLKPYEATERKLSGGAYVEDVSPGGPADKAGLKKGDVIEKIGGKQIDGQIDLRNAMLENAPKTTVKVEYIHDGKTQTASVTLEEAKPIVSTAKTRTFDLNGKDPGDIFGPNGLKDLQEKLKKDLRSKDNSNDDETDVPSLHGDKARLGVGVANLNDEIRKKQGLAFGQTGVVVLRVDDGSVGSQNGLQIGDIIESIGGKSVTSVEQLTAEISKLKWGDHTRIKVVRYDGKGGRTTIDREITFK